MENNTTMMFGGQDGEVVVSNNTPRITPGVHEVVADKIEGALSSTKQTPYLRFYFKLKNVEEAKTTWFDFYLTSKAYSRLKHLVTNMVTEARYKEMVASTIEELGEVYNTILGGMSVRIQFNGEEKMLDNGKVVVNPVIPWSDFAEPIESGAEFPVVDAANTQLVFAANTQIKKLVVSPDPIASSNSYDEFFTSAPNDLPFD